MSKQPAIIPGLAPAQMKLSLRYIDEQGGYLLSKHKYTETDDFTGRTLSLDGIDFTVVRAFLIPDDFFGDERITTRLFAVATTGELAVGWGYQDNHVCAQLTGTVDHFKRCGNQQGS